MALIAACVLTPGIYFAINSPAGVIGTTAAGAADVINQWALFKPITGADLELLAKQVGETSLLSRTGGAPSLAVGMAHLFAQALGGPGAMALWYHFAIMFEALFILTTLDAGTRVGRFMLQDMLGNVWKPLGKVSSTPASVFTSALFVSMWGYFLYQGVTDPLGGINSLWPLFGISNQLLATVALCVGTTVFIKMGKAKYAWMTLLPMTWLTIVTMTAGLTKIFSADPRLGFLSHAALVESQIVSGKLPAAIKSVEAAQRIIFNDRLDTGVAAFFLISVVVILAASLREWMAVLSGRKVAVSTESKYVASQLIGEAA
jgi:carbon starvation protein